MTNLDKQNMNGGSSNILLNSYALCISCCTNIAQILHTPVYMKHSISNISCTIV